MTVDIFEAEIDEAQQTYDKFVVCLNKTPDEFRAALMSLVTKALEAYEKREPGLRHGIALDQYVTVIVSQSKTERPLCGIYFNLHSPYQRQLKTTARHPANQPPERE